MKKILLFGLGVATAVYFVYKNKEEIEKKIPRPVIDWTNDKINQGQVLYQEVVVPNVEKGIQEISKSADQAIKNLQVFANEVALDVQNNVIPQVKTKAGQVKDLALTNLQNIQSNVQKSVQTKVKPATSKSKTSTAAKKKSPAKKTAK